MNRRLVGLAGALAWVTSAVATGCYSNPQLCSGAGERPAGLRGEDVVGAYKGSDGRITLNSDGSFTTVGWPTELRGAAVGDPQSRTGSGTWFLNGADDESSFVVRMSFHEISGYLDGGADSGHYGDGLMVSGSRKNPHLYSFVGDPDGCDVTTFTHQ